MKLTDLRQIVLILTFALISFGSSAGEIRTTAGMPKIGDKYQHLINLDSRRKLILPDGIWEVNNVFEDKEANWHAPWKVITLISDEPTSPFRMTVIRFFSSSAPSWPKEDCETKNNQYSFGHDTTGTKGSRSICSSFFEWSSPQRSIRADLPRMFPFYWEKALSKLPDEFVKTLPQSMAHLEIISSKSNGLYIRQDVLIDLNSAGTNASEIRQSSSLGKVESTKSNLQKWRITYVQAMSRAYLDSESIDAGSYAFKAFGNGNITNTAKTEPTQNTAKNQPTTAPTSTPTTERLETQLALERKQIEKEKALFEEQKQLLEQRQRLEEEKKKLELEALQSQKELLAIQEERRQLEQRRLEKLQEDKLRQERLVAAEAEAKAKLEAERAKKEEERVLAEEAKKREEAERKEAAEKKRAAELAKAEEEKRRKEAEALALAEKKQQLEEERRAAAEAKKAEDEERKRLEAYKKSAPTIEVTQSAPDEFGAIILDITVSKPTKLLAINGEVEGASKDGKYRVKRILRKTGKTIFSFTAIDDYGNKTTVMKSFTSQVVENSNAPAKDKDGQELSIEKLGYGDRAYFCGGFLGRTSGLIEENSKIFTGKELEALKKLEKHLTNQSMAAMTNAITSKGDISLQGKGIDYASRNIGRNISILTDQKSAQYKTMIACLQANPEAKNQGGNQAKTEAKKPALMQAQASKAIKVSKGKEWVEGWGEFVRYLYIQSVVDQLTITKVVLNRGKCFVQGPLTNRGLSNFPVDVQFGDTVKIDLNVSQCNLIEVEITTNLGTTAYSLAD